MSARVERPVALNDASRWRLELAQRMAPAIAANSKVAAIVVAGSTSRGCADRYSDLEIGIFWSAPPSDEELTAYIVPLGGELWELDPHEPDDDVWYLEWGLGGFKIDTRNMTLAALERVFEAVLTRHDTSIERQNVLSALQHAIPLVNPALVAQWQARLAAYPDELARAMVREHLLLDDWYWAVNEWIERADWPLVYRALCEATFELLCVLMGLNRVYHPGYKWLDRLAADLLLAPADLATRLRALFRHDPRAAREETRQLVLEVDDLVRRHMPEIDLTHAEARFLHERPPFDGPPR